MTSSSRPLLLSLLSLATGLALSSPVHADTTTPPDEIDRIIQTLDDMKVSIESIKTDVQSITTGLKDSRSYLQTLALSPETLVGQDLKAAAAQAQNLSFEQWSAALSNNKEAIAKVLLSDSTMRENIARISLQEKDVEAEVGRIKAKAAEISQQFGTVAQEGKAIKKTLGTAFKLGSLFLKVKSVTSELKGVDKLVADAGTESGQFIQQVGTLFALVPAAVPSPELLASLTPPAPAAASAPTGAPPPTPTPSLAAATTLVATPSPAAAPAGRGILAGLWSGQVTHLASGSTVRIELCLGTPHPGQIDGYLLIPVRDEQSPLFLTEAQDGKFVFVEGAEAATDHRQVVLSGADPGLSRLTLEIRSADAIAEFTGTLDRR